VEGGLAAPELCRELGISTAAFYKWRAKYGMDVLLIARMKELEAENALIALVKKKRIVWNRDLDQKQNMIKIVSYTLFTVVVSPLFDHVGLYSFSWRSWSVTTIKMWL
jgi:hypothetical protein